MNYCTKCGEKLEEGSVYCGKCGAKVSGEGDTFEACEAEISYADEGDFFDKAENFIGRLVDVCKSIVFGTRDFVMQKAIPYIVNHKKLFIAGAILLGLLLIGFFVARAIAFHVLPAECDYCHELIEGRKYSIEYHGKKGVFCSDCAPLVRGLQAFANLFD